MKNLKWWLFFVWHLFDYVKTSNCEKVAQDFSQIVFPHHVNYAEVSKEHYQLVFQIKDGHRVLSFHLQTRGDLLEGDSFCHMNGFVYTQESVSKVELSVCNGIFGTIFSNGSIIEVIRPVLDYDIKVTFSMLSKIPHVLMMLQPEDDLPVYSNFQAEEIIEGSTFDKFQSRRKRRARRVVTMSLINRADTVVYLYYMHPRTHRRQYFLRLRLNEKNNIQSYAGTTWLAYDRSQQPLLLNKRYNILLMPRHSRTSKLQVVITSKKKRTTTDYWKPMKPRYVEVYAMADQSFVKKYRTKEITKRFIEGVVSGANMLFRHESLNISLIVVLKGIKYLNKEKVTISRDARKSLRSACDFMFEARKRERLDFDFGIFFTRKQYGYSGYTPLYQMCVDRKSCTLLYGTSLQTAFVLAHEIAHSVGVNHDGDVNDCSGDTSKGSIMAPLIHSRFDKYFWSKCSRKQIKENLKYFSCLKNVPSNLPKPTDLPGAQFDLDDQCQYTFGEGYNGCLGRKTYNYCKYMYCSYPKRQDRCLYYSLAPADGSKCSENQWCIQGKCLPQGQLTPDPVDGNWSEWSPWSHCSQTCGKGVRTRSRRCNDPRPLFGGKKCEGLDKEWDLCNDKRCKYDAVFEDKRNNACYRMYGGEWKWLSSFEITQRVKSLKLHLNFESGFGNWTHSKKAETKWRRNKGLTPTTGTGPDSDHTYGNSSGYYMYMEASHPMLRGHSAILLSPHLLIPRVCLTMFYHMNGKRMGKLEILKLDLNEKTVETLWSRKGDAGRNWYPIMLNITSDKRYMIGIKVTRGSSYFSDIAIDDIRVKSGLCQHDEGYVNVDEPCTIMCQSPQHNFTNFEKFIPNGLRCNQSTSNLCVNGKCKDVGCDNVIGSRLQYDICGVCGGDNSTCSSFQQIELNVRPNTLNQPVFIIPEGATNFQLTKTASPKVKLAMHDMKKNVAYYYKYEEKNHHFQWQYFTIQTSTFRYQTFQNHTDKIYIQKIDKNTAAQVKLITQGSKLDNSSVHLQYSFYISNGTKRDVFSWMFDQWSNCSAVCGGGERTGQYKCLNVGKNEVVDAGNCSSPEAEIKNKTMKCNDRKCEVSYFYKAWQWSKCSRCGVAGVTRRNYTCMEIVEGRKLNKVVNQTFCKALRKPHTKARCYKPCPQTARKCKERSPLCTKFVKKGYCKYRSVQGLCCKSCFPTDQKQKIPSRK